MAIWSIYISPDEEKVLKNRIKSIAQKKRWSFSQAVSGLLKEHLIDEKHFGSDEEDWNVMSVQSFFEGYPARDSVYDKL